MRVNYHTHTNRCGHANGEDEQYVKAAIEAGFEVLGFSDHVPFENIHAPLDRMDFDQMGSYVESILDLKKKYADQIEIKLGFEIEYYPEQNDYYKKLRRFCDYLILGQHYRDLSAYGYDNYNDDEDLKVYTRQLVEGMQSGLVDIVAHPEYFMLGRNRWNAACEEAAHAIAKTASETGIPLEINLNGIRFGQRDYDGIKAFPYPFLPFWEIVSMYPVKVLYGLDAHQPMTLFERKRIDLFKDDLEKIGLRIDLNYRF